MRSKALTAAVVVGLSWTVGGSAQGTAGKQWPSRTWGGQPDITGVWGSADTGNWSWNYEPRDYLYSIGMQRSDGLIQGNSGAVATALTRRQTIIVDPPTGILPYQPWALERRKGVMDGHLHPKPWQIDTQTRGWPDGVPRQNVYSSLDGSVGGPVHILQTVNSVVFVYETQHEFRIVPLDGRPQPGKDIKLWEGSSRGHWDNNTLVIDVTNQNDSTRFNVIGDFHSDEMRVTERWTMVDRDTLDYRATVDDPKVYTKPWTIGLTFKRTPPGTELMEYAGVEGDRNAAIATDQALQRK
jgi:hypothetical protein